jgi:predicted metal-binding membrane protein
MDTRRLLLTLRLARPARRRGFCPACGVGVTGTATAAASGIQMAADGVTVAVVLAVAAAAWAITAWQMQSSGMMMGSGMTTGLGPVWSFAATWTEMMAAMMLPSAIPLVYRFARQAEGRRARPVALAVLALVYLAVWLAFGVVCYLAYNALGMPMRNRALVGGVALGLAALYSLTPLKRISQDRCREVCALHGPLPFNLVRAGALAGWRYGLSCLGCTAGLMVAMVLVGMSSLTWTVVLAALVLVYKFVPPKGLWLDVTLAAVVAGLGIAYVVIG